MMALTMTWIMPLMCYNQITTRVASASSRLRGGLVVGPRLLRHWRTRMPERVRAHRLLNQGLFDEVEVRPCLLLKKLTPSAIST
jgi:hypothetical protein